jgi:serpin B
VEEKTKQKIKDFLPTMDITPLTRLVLTNAIYFKGSGVARFNQKNTADAPFLLEEGKTIKTPMMVQTGKFNYLEEGSFDMLELPYAGSRLSMLVMLPGKGLGLSKMEKLLTPENLRYSWAELLKRVFGSMFCSHCGGRLRILCAIIPPNAIAKI